MFVNPSKLRKNKILKGRTINFETVKKTHGNIVVIPTLDKDAFISTLKSTLFRPMQLMSIYTPRRIKPRGRSVVTVNQKDYYADMRAITGGRIKKGKTTISAYAGQNLVYDVFNDYVITRDALSNIRKNQALQMDLIKYFTDTINKIADDPEYENVYIVFPMEKPYDEVQKTLINCNDFFTTDPLALFMAGIKRDIIKLSNLSSKIKGIYFYVPSKDILLALDLDDPEFDKNFPSFQQKLRRINSVNSGEESIDSVVEDAVVDISYLNNTELDKETQLENKKEEIKKLIFSKISKTIRANLTDFEAASAGERDLIAIIDDKIEKYLSKPTNLKKTLNDMTEELEADNEIKLKALKFVETKKASAIKAETMSKNLEKETDIISSLQDLDDDGSDNIARKFNVGVDHIDERILTSHLASIDDEYNKKQMMTDVTNILSAFSESTHYPMTVDSISIDDSSSYSDEKYTYNVRYKTGDGKTLSFQLDVPKIVDKRYLFLGGGQKVIKRQLVRLPIVKTKSDRVELTSNYAKMTIERSSGKVSRKVAYLLKRLKEIGEQSTFRIDYGDNSAVNATLGYINDFEYEEMASFINSIETPKYRLIFNRDNMRDELDLNINFEAIGLEENYFESGKTPFGLELTGETCKAVFFIEDTKVYRLDATSKGTPTKIHDSLFDFIVGDVLKVDLSVLPSIGKSFVYTNVKFLQTTYPVFAVVASQNGLTDILNRYIGKENYFKSDKQVKNKIDYVEVKFKDTYLYYKDTFKNTLLLNAIYLFSPADYNYAEFDADIPYTHFFIKKLGASVGMHTRNTLRINLDVFIDPITRDVLRDLKQPTDIIDILLYSNTLLVGNQYKPQNDMTNYRVRSNELIADIMYQTIADAYVNYEKHRINGRPTNLAVPKGMLIKRILEQPNVNAKSILNPVIEVEQIAQASAKGFRGVNINDAFTLEMRAYDRSMEGFISGNSTPYSGQAGITRSLSYDPAISSVRGYIPYIDGAELSAANILSPTELLSSFTAAGADAPRQAMQVAQTGHTMPIKSSSKQLIGSGMNKTLAFMISDDFAFKAKKPGVVAKIDKQNKLALLTYDDGTKDAIDLAPKLDKNSNMGFYINQLFEMTYKEGERFDADDVIAYNPSYFSGKGKNVDYKPGTLAKIAIASTDNAYEDSTIICETLGERCTSKINILKPVALGKNAVIHKILEVGDKVDTGDHIIEFTNSFDDPDTAEFLQKLQSAVGDSVEDLTHETVDAKFSGVITDIQLFYNCPFEELNPSMQELIKKYRKRIGSRADAIKDVKTGSVHVPPLEQVSAKKIGQQEFPMDGGMIIAVWVEYEDVMGKGDKLTFSTALKGIVSKVLKRSEAPISTYRPENEVEAILTPTGIISRMTSDIYSMTFGNKVLVESGKQVREIWNDKR